MTTPITDRTTAPYAWREVDPYLRSTIPSGAGCYVVVIDGRAAYIGQTVNLQSRIRSYNIRRDYSGGWFTPWGQFDSVTVKVKPPRRYGEWAMRELRLLRRLKPRFNSMCIGGR